MHGMFKAYFSRLSEAERDAYAKRAGTDANYIKTHLIAPRSRRKIPRPKLMQGLAEASDGALTQQDLLAYFYGADEPESEAA